MKMPIVAVLCLAASLAWAQEDESEKDEITTVDLRVSVIENINVTSDKAPLVSADESDPEIDAILDEVEASESDEE